MVGITAEKGEGALYPSDACHSEAADAGSAVVAMARGYGAPAKTESRDGDGASAATKNLPSARPKGQILRFAQDDTAKVTEGQELATGT